MRKKIFKKKTLNNHQISKKRTQKFLIFGIGFSFDNLFKITLVGAIIKTELNCSKWGTI